MVLSSSTLKSLLDKNDFIGASNYAKEQLAKDSISHMSEDLVSSAGKCINTLAFHIYHMNPTPEQKIGNEIYVLVDSFEHAMERVISISNNNMVNAAFVNKIIMSSYYVSIKYYNFHERLTTILFPRRDAIY